ncbi:MAG: hypothetical protein IID63_01030 [candidate division Zixibacteria bacterium]|nr:hypothetical protein [candidate division Zixibacteria bacterium]
MAIFLKTVTILALVFAIGCSGKTGFEPDDFPTYVEQDGVSLRINYTQDSNSPHPAPSIDFCLPESGKAILTLNNATGYLIKVLLDKEIDAGCHSVNFDVTNEDGKILQDGIYMTKLQFQDLIFLSILYFKTSEN